MTSTSRPRLGSRAISDMHPLISPSPTKGDLGRGTQASIGGARVVSGGRTALGGIAPLSPFLSLPPAPSAEEVQRQRSQDENLLSVHVSHARCSSGSNVEGGESAKKKSFAPSDAAHMIRSYSMPVATQRDYEAQREAIERRHQWRESFNASNKHWDTVASQSPLSSLRMAGGNNAMTSSQSSMGSAHYKHQLQSTMQDKLQQPITTSRKIKTSPRLQPRSPLSIITINESLPNNEHINEMDLGSGSDEADVVTPRATSPMAEYFGKLDTISPYDNLAQFIHPGHLQPPPGFSS